MNILFFLKPKIEVAYIFANDTLRQTIEKMEYHRYSCIPIISKNGTYIGSLTEGDILWGLKNRDDLSVKDSERIIITSIKRRMDYQPVHVESKMEDLIDKAMNQNFVPVVDDQNNFIGIITRKDIIEYCYSKMQREE